MTFTITKARGIFDSGFCIVYLFNLKFLRSKREEKRHE